MNSSIFELETDEVEAVNGGVWGLVALVMTTGYAASELGRALMARPVMTMNHGMIKGIKRWI